MDRNNINGAVPKQISRTNIRRNRSSENDQNQSRRHQGINMRSSSSSRKPNNFNKNRNPTFQQKRFQLGFKRLEELVDMEPDAVIISLANEKINFEDLLSERLSDDYLVLILKVLSKMCNSSFNENKAFILSIAAKVSFIDSLLTYLLQLVIQDERDKKRNSYFWRDIDDFFNNVVKYCQTIIDMVPSIAYERLPKLVKALNTIIPAFEMQYNVVIPEKIKQTIKDIEHKLNLIIKNYTKKVSIESKEEEEPPEDFHQISIYPTSEELLIPERSFVRQNIIKGAYRNIPHYLDVQFRLLREDFVGPLRQAVCSYTNPKSNKKLENVQFHKKVQFIKKCLTDRDVGIILQYTFRKEIRNLENTKRFMFGSLLCFAKANLSDIFFGKVIDRKDIKRGYIVVVLNDNFKDFQWKTDYIMFECSIFFEPYYQVLKALKNMNCDNFPLEKYLINVDTQIEMPDYISHDTMITLHSHTFPILSTDWPSKEILQLNNSQYVAFQNSLKQKLAVIQGPPGTGKTYLGLKLAKYLIKNKRVWFQQKPILVICYTNHALDQFLMGLTDTTNDIIRFGGQSREESLKTFSLSNVRKTFCNKERGTSSLLFQQRKEIETILSNSRSINAYLNAITAYDGIIKLNDLASLDNTLKNTWFSYISNKDLANWLMSGYRFKKCSVFDKTNAFIQDLKENFELIPVVQDKPILEDVDMQNRLLEDDDFEISFIGDTYNVSIKALVDQSNQTIQKINMLEQEIINGKTSQTEYHHLYALKELLQSLQNRIDYLQLNMNKGKSMKRRVKPQIVDYNQPENISPGHRWMLYFYWLSLYEKKITKSLLLAEKLYADKSRLYYETKDIADMHVIKHSLVLGMTTTGAARMQTLLQSLSCNIVIVEEAAEVLESHVIVSLTKNCEHLILIGDHLQLRPSTADYTMDRKYNLGISLFERMVLNGMHCNVLDLQHRMRPEIAELIVPAIYPHLENANVVQNYPDIRGVEKSLFFITHSEPEHKDSIYNEASKENIHEVQYLLKLARYLILNGYEPGDITILAAYTAQMFLFCKLKKEHYNNLLENIKITVLDNYQGEENKIVLLSLVRNNEENNIGFLRLQNRVCVALSRAKQGLYIMGNIDLLSANSQIWLKIQNVLNRQNNLGSALKLICQVHNTVTEISKPDDFNNVPEGGCNKICDVVLECGHHCLKMCHIIDNNHVEYKCTIICNKILCDLQHPCPKYCYEECGPCDILLLKDLPCGHQNQVPCHVAPEEFKCPSMVEKTLPCEHKAQMSCFRDPKMFLCQTQCDARIEPCGHSCSLLCHAFKDPDHLKYKCCKPCAKLRAGCTQQKENHICPNLCFQECLSCTIETKKQRTVCPHIYKVPCNKDVDSIICNKPCKKILSCGHKCCSRCGEPCKPCKEIVDKELQICKHKIKTVCSQEPNRKCCNERCPLLLDCGHKCTNLCREPCTTKCEYLITDMILAACGHKIQVPCYLRNKEQESNDYNILKHCKAPCNIILKCGHKCVGTCGECAQGRIHKQCQEKCGFILICGHKCQIACKEACRTCQQPCSFRCKHSVCKKKCGEPCTICIEPCTRKCEHSACTKKCGEQCNVPPCNKPCKRKLTCGHPCVGFCGDPCPKLCRICNHEELTEILFGTEDEEDARFVYLKECGHTLESTGMDTWMQSGSGEIGSKHCPKCKTTLSLTLRYGDFIKQANADIIEVKRKYFGASVNNEAKKFTIQKKIIQLKSNRVYITLIKNGIMEELINTIQINIKKSSKGKRQIACQKTLTAYIIKLELLEDILNVYNSQDLHEQRVIETARCFTEFLFNFLSKNPDVISKQESNDISMEIIRFNRIMQFLKMTDERCFTDSRIESAKQDCHQLMVDIQPYSEDKDAEFKFRLEKLKKLTSSGLNISAKEKTEIMQALNLTRGHYFKCPNGHIYIITECGGANQIGRCNECGATIGGMNHALHPTNAVATEMDGATYPAFSDAANLANYAF